MRKLKDDKLDVIRDTLEKDGLQTQAELREKLKEKGFEVSQATISRALKELGYARAPVGNGSYRLVRVEGRDEHIAQFFKLGLEEIIPVGNLVIIKTRPGNAQAIAGAIDRTRIEDVVGTIAGDDTILAIAKNESLALKVVKSLRKFME